jgi:cholesterol transport system auxiliary component
MKRFSRANIPRRPFIVGALLCALTGCVDLPFNRPPAQLFILSPKSTFDTSLPKVSWQLSVNVPIAEAGIDTSRIAVRHSPVRLNYFEGVNWSDITPRMIQTLLIESFESTGRIIGVGRQNIGLRADYSLISELREFQAENVPGKPPQVRVRLIAKLIRLPQRVIVAGTNRESVVSTQGEGIDNIVNAFDTALGDVLKTIVTWSLKAGKEDYANRRLLPDRKIRRRP